MPFFYEVRAGDAPVSTHPSYAPNAARIGLAYAIAEEREATDFPRPVCVFEVWYPLRWPSTRPMRTRAIELSVRELDRRADARELVLAANRRARELDANARALEASR